MFIYIFLWKKLRKNRYVEAMDLAFDALLISPELKINWLINAILQMTL
jgi:hypothetical protein